MLKKIITQLIVFTVAIGVLFSEEVLEEGPLIFNLETAVSQAINCNRQILNTLDNYYKATYGVSIAEDEFHLKISPNAKVGYSGGGKDGTGGTYGGGFHLSKKFMYGTSIKLSPLLVKTADHFRTDMDAIISQPLLRGLSREYQLSNLKAAQFQFRSAERQVYIAQSQLIIKTITALYDVVRSHQTASIYKESYERVEKLYQATQWKQKIGLADPLDAYRAEIELQRSADLLRSAYERLQAAEDNFRDLLSLPLTVPIIIEVPLDYTVCEMSLDQAMDSGLQSRIEIYQAMDQWQENNRLSRVAKQSLWPDLNLVLNYNSCGRDEIFSRSCLGRRDNAWGFGFTSSTDLNRAKEKFQYEQSVLAIYHAERAIEQAKSNVILEIKRAFRTLDRAYEKILFQKDQIHASTGELRLAQVKFEHGMANNFDVIQAEQNLRNAELGSINAIIDHIIGEYQFLAAIGLLCDGP